MAAYPVGLTGLFVKLFPRHQISLVSEPGDFLRRKYGRYGYRGVRQLLLPVGLKVPTKQLKRAPLWLNEGRAYGSGRSVLWSQN